MLETNNKRRKRKKLQNEFQRENLDHQT